MKKNKPQTKVALFGNYNYGPAINVDTESFLTAGETYNQTNNQIKAALKQLTFTTIEHKKEVIYFNVYTSGSSVERVEVNKELTTAIIGDVNNSFFISDIYGSSNLMQTVGSNVQGFLWMSQIADNTYPEYNPNSGPFPCFPFSFNVPSEKITNVVFYSYIQPSESLYQWIPNGAEEPAKLYNFTITQTRKVTGLTYNNTSSNHVQTLDVWTDPNPPPGTTLAFGVVVEYDIIKEATGGN